MVDPPRMALRRKDVARAILFSSGGRTSDTDVDVVVSLAVDVDIDDDDDDDDDDDVGVWSHLSSSWSSLPSRECVASVSSVIIASTPRLPGCKVPCRSLGWSVRRHPTGFPVCVKY